ncbi:alpha/beta hydrolase family protein [Pedobacter sp. JCM 36344]|uniref:alpha/beta hydrolase family protein n=1 Tax=Pedobacter sp. JCM 36344 TaxID=3374280 RepID=UPI00397CCE6A
MKKIIIVASIFLVSGITQAQNFVGDWNGVLNISGAQNIKLRIVLHISEKAGVYTSTMDSPDQGAKGMLTDKTVVLDNAITIEASKLAVKYVGTYQADSNRITGTFSQGPGSIPLTLYKVTSSNNSGSNSFPGAKTVKRTQDPSDISYLQEEVTFNNTKANVKLAATLTMPKDKGATKKLVILISGSGPQNRNEEVKQFNHRPFLVWSDWLTRQGIAVLRYDDRGVGKSTGNFGNSTSADFADDVRAAIAYVKSRSDLAKLSIGLMGHSEGGMIAPMVAADDHTIGFVVLLAAPGIPTTELLVIQSADQMRLLGAVDSVVEVNAASNGKLYQLIKSYSNLGVDELKPKLDSALTADLSSRGADVISKAEIDKQVAANISQLSGPWFRYFISFDPTPYLSKLKCPVLALNGTLDMQVSYKENLEGISNSLKKAGNKRFEVLPLTGLNHLFQTAKTGGVIEYGEIEETVSPIVLAKVTDWINKR